MPDVWSDEHVVELKRRWFGGQSIAKIAAAMRRTPESVKSKLRRLKLPLGNKRVHRRQAVSR